LGKKKAKSEEEPKDIVLPVANLAPFSTSFDVAPSSVSFNNVRSQFIWKISLFTEGVNIKDDQCRRSR